MQSIEPEKREKQKPVLLILVTVLLLGIATVLGVLYYNLKVESERTEVVLEEEKNDLASQLNNLYNEYDSLRTENDTMNLKLEEQQDKIKRLLAVNASNAEKIGLYKKELSTLREIMKSYIVQIDSLNQKNQLLLAENQEFRTKLRDVETTKAELEVQKEELTSKVEIASILQAKNIAAIPLNKNSKEKDKINKVEKIRTCFTLRENPIIEPGTKTVYMQIVRPDGVILTSSPDNMVEVNGQQLIFSDSRDIEYENKDIEMCIYWDKNEELIEGTYEVNLYSSGNFIGNTTFALK